MEIDFRNDHLQRLCNETAYAIKKLGSKSAQKLQRRLSDISAASNVLELPNAGRPHALDGKKKGQFAVDLDGAMRLTFISDNQPTPIVGKDNVNWSKVTKIKIIAIEDYHD